MSLPPILKDRLKLPVIGAPMFIASGPELVIAQCRAGIVGTFPALNARPKKDLGAWLSELSETLGPGDAPFAVNQIVHKSNSRLDHDLGLCIQHKVPIIITSLGAREDVNKAVHAYGGIVLHDVINDRFARKAIEKGADGVIAVAAGGGAHAGTWSPFALVQEIRQWFDGPLVLAGAIATGRAVRAAQVMGADLAYVGSPFLATHEARISTDYKDMVAAGGAADIVYSDAFSGVNSNYLRGSIEKHGMNPDALPKGDVSKMDFGDKDHPETGTPKVWRDIWAAGHGIGAVKKVQSAASYIGALKAGYEKALAD